MKEIDYIIEFIKTNKILVKPYKLIGIVGSVLKKKYFNDIDLVTVGNEKNHKKFLSKLKSYLVSKDYNVLVVKRTREAQKENKIDIILHDLHSPTFEEIGDYIWDEVINAIKSECKVLYGSKKGIPKIKIQKSRFYRHWYDWSLNLKSERDFSKFKNYLIKVIPLDYKLYPKLKLESDCNKLLRILNKKQSWMKSNKEIKEILSENLNKGALMMKILAIGDFHGKFPEKLRKRIEKEKLDLILSSGDYAGIDDWRPLIKKQFKELAKGKEFNIKEYLGEKKYNKLLKKDYLAGKIILKEINKLKIKTFSVFGNGDWYKVFFNDVGKFYEKLIKKLKYIKNINRGKARFGGLKIIGFGGYLDSDVYFTEKGKRAIADNEKSSKKRKKRYNKEEKRLTKLMKFNPDILLTHYPPYKCLDKLGDKGFMLTGSNMGVSLYNRAIKKFKPSLVVCGHMHENQGKCKIGKTLVINTGAACEGKAVIIEFDEEKRKVEKIKFIR